MNKLKQYLKVNWLIILIVLIILGVLFYWFQWHPSQIRKSCSIEAKVKAIDKLQNIVQKEPWRYGGPEEVKGKYLPSVRDSYYKYCLTDHGLSQ